MKKGFTLLELIIVIGVIAILASIVVLVLNPAEILKQTRDGKRLADMSALKNAISLHLGTGSRQDTVYCNLNEGCGATPAQSVNWPMRGYFTVAGTTGYNGTNCPFVTIINTYGSSYCTLNAAVSVAGSGWVNVNLGDVTGNVSPISSLPLDPVNNNFYNYSYAGNDSNLTFELNTRLESAKYRDLMNSDGGDRSGCSGAYQQTDCYYEVGLSLTL